MIVEISYSKGQWNYPVEEPLGRLYLAEATFFELFKVQGKMFLLHSIDGSKAEVLENKFATTFCVIDDETEAIEKFLQEVQRTMNERGIDLKTCHVTEELKPTLRKCRELLAQSPRFQSLAEQIIEKCPRSPKLFY